MRLHEPFEYHARTAPDRPCAEDGERRLTYGEMARETDRLVNALRAEGLKPGDRFAMLSRNSADMVAGYLAASKSGCVALPLNWRLAPGEWKQILTQGGAKLVIAQDEFVDAFAKTGLDLPVFPGKSYRAWLDAQPDRATAADGGDDTVLYQMYTSGTTGEPKGALLTHYAVLNNSLQTLPVFEHRFGQRDRALFVMPMFHAGAVSFVVGTLVSGGTLVIHREFNPKTFVDALAGGITVANTVPAMLQMALTSVPDVAERDYSRLKTIIYGASPIAEETLRAAMKAFRCQFYQGYGQTETTACLTMLNHADHERALREKPELLLSAGRALPGTEIRIEDPDGTVLASGDVGEIVVRGPQLMRGYWNRPEATAATIRDGWLHTGDAGYLDDEGYLYVCDRVKDMIISGGENIYPREIENVLFDLPAVADAAVIGVPDDKFGESVLAVIVLRAGAKLTADEVIAHCRAHLGGYKIPRRVEFAAALPRNPSGKVLKKELRAPYWKDRRRNV
ncbi:MAG TPA: long-chain-fatty-acid--CoA ligase [Nevskiaceae bacterium]|nr:long-chain-fatty-acid--CoA ligase [Nevskiaceae bacterium]